MSVKMMTQAQRDDLADWISQDPVIFVDITAISRMVNQRRLLEAAWRLLDVMSTEIN
jgi:hypothetical protein